MSTKTTFKRISLVAVAALGFGVLTSVAPASAATIVPTALTIGTIPVAQIGVANSTPITVTAPLTTTGSDTFTVSVRVTASPVGSAYRNLIGANKTIDGSTAASTFGAAAFASGSSVGALISIALGTSQTGLIGSLFQNTDDRQTVSATHTSQGAGTAPTTAKFLIGITPDIAGSYTILVSTQNAVASATLGEYIAGDANASYTFTTGGAVTTVVLAAVTGASTEDSTTGQLIKATITSSTGGVAQLGVSETLSITTNSSTSRLRLVSSQSTPTIDANATVVSMTSTHFTDGVGYFLINNTAVETVIITATGSGLLASTITSTLSTTVKTRVTPTLATLGDTVANAAAGGQAGHATIGGTSAAATSTAATTATTHSYLATVTAGTAGEFLEVTVVDTAGKVTGIAGLTYTYALASASTTTATVTIAAACTAVATCFTATVLGTTSAAVTVTAATAAQLTVAVTSGTPTVIKQAHSASSVLNVIVKDQFRAVVGSSVVTISTTGRNASSSNTTVTSNSSGVVSYTRTDAGTSATTNTQDVVTFAGAAAGSATVTINYAASGLGVTTIALATPTTDDTAASGITHSDINASSSSGAQATLVSLTATVKDVNASLLAGVPVVFTTASAGAAVLSTTATVYTSSAGTAAASVYCWTAGIKTFTATVGTITTTGTMNCRQGGATGTNSPTEVHTISAVKSGSSIVVTARDRFGNLVQGVALWATRTGNGTFGGGSNTNGQTTTVAGTAEFVFNAGTADSVVTIQASDSATAAPANATYGQTGNLAGIAVASTATTQTAYATATVGTIDTAETGIGAALSAAGINSVTVSYAADNTAAAAVQAAIDAGAEATDAANAATDAANAAAEAADAATAAAEDATDAANAAVEAAQAASDAVAALATQVATLISGLKAQLTALTNLIIKIQKKLKA